MNYARINKSNDYVNILRLFLNSWLVNNGGKVLVFKE